VADFDPRAIEVFGDTHVGQVRTVNQDSIGAFELEDGAGRIVMVADGMGGHRGGEVASRMAVDCVRDALLPEKPDPDTLVDAIRDANTRINTAGSEDRTLAGMGTTGVILLFADGGRAWVAHVGDSRAYRVSGGQIEALTEDHSVVGELVRLGRITADEARSHPQRNEILRAIGTQEEVKIEINPVTVVPGDRFLLCSDGLSTLVTDEEIGQILTRERPEQAVGILIDLANERGGTDNISVQIAAIPGGAEVKPELETTAGLKGAAGDGSRVPPAVWILVGALGLIATWLAIR
jgi:serine/threonine protein phosphatase PrpC